MSKYQELLNELQQELEKKVNIVDGFQNNELSDKHLEMYNWFLQKAQQEKIDAVLERMYAIYNEESAGDAEKAVFNIVNKTEEESIIDISESLNFTYINQ